MISDKEIINNMTANEKFKIICRIKKINLNEMASTIWRIINNSDLEEKKQYATTCQYQDLYGDIYSARCINIDYNLLETKENLIKTDMNKENKQTDWNLYVIENQFTKEQKEFIKLALDCKVESVVIK